MTPKIILRREKKFFGPGNNFMSEEIISNSRRKSPGAKFNFETPGRNLLERNLISKLREEISWSKDLILKSGEEILCREK
jgi:hypothetical protein